MSSPSLDVELVYDRFLDERGFWDEFARTVADLTPKWAGDVEIYKSPADRQAADVTCGAALRRAVVATAQERGATYRALVAAHGAGDERVFGSAELRGATPDFTLVIRIDERPVSRLGAALQLGNSVNFQLRQARVQGRPAEDVAYDLLAQLSQRTAPVWGVISTTDEYDHKVMADGPGARAVGRDLGSYLPGLFAVNFFGAPYVDLIGRERISAAPEVELTPTDGGIIVALGSPRDWDHPARQALEERLLNHLGREYFFSKKDLDRETRAPQWCLRREGSAG